MRSNRRFVSAAGLICYVLSFLPVLFLFVCVTLTVIDRFASHYRHNKAGAEVSLADFLYAWGGVFVWFILFWSAGYVLRRVDAKIAKDQADKTATTGPVFDCLDNGMVVTAPRSHRSFGLRTIFILVTLAAAVLGWVAYQLNWIRDRHHFLAQHALRTTTANIHFAPSSLWLFGEQGVCWITVTDPSSLDYGRRLFPEAQFAVWTR